jgi:hypothetical protein
VTTHERPTPEELARLFDPEGAKVGKLFWAVRPAHGGVKVGDEAGGVVHYPRVQYRMVQINGVKYDAHAIIWTITHGRRLSPGMDICHHSDTDGLNNHPDNLVEMPHASIRERSATRLKGPVFFKA